MEKRINEIVNDAFNTFLFETPETVMDMDGTIGVEFKHKVGRKCVIDDLDNIIRKKMDEYNIGKEIEYLGDTYEYKESYLSSDNYIVIRFDMK